ncbi:glycosyltransferase [Candidatus Uhrbacteria bacterium]|nr:glycosyltransferase [Candidatus Uhrbacteria bacterium]MBD3283867.1 glycosyltransferase [Candidatus Uhrbacteria bacterium]
MDRPRVTFVTVCYNTPHLVRLLLRGLEESGCNIPYEYLLVDNGSDGTAEMVRTRFPWVRVIQPGRNLGFAKANNLAFAEAQGEYVMLINPDLTFFPGEVERLIAFAEACPEAGVIGPRLENPNGERQETCTRFPHPLMPVFSRTFLGRLPWGRRALQRYHMHDVSHEVPHEADAIYGAAVLIRKRVLEEVGDLDERFFMYYEDVDFCRRTWEMGWKVVYAPVARFVHYHQRESMISAPWQVLTNRLVRIHITSGVRYFMKYRGKPLPRVS